MVTVTGKLIIPDGNTEAGASIEFMLSGYGSWIPKGQGVGGSAGSFSSTAVVGQGGQFTVSLVGNDVIHPPTTYYVATTRNANGDVLQCNAYRFLDGQEYDFDFTPPYDPNQPPPPLPPLITNWLDTVAAADNMVFDGSAWLSFKTTLTGDVTQPVFANMIPGNLYTFIIDQDGTGNHVFIWPANVKNATPVPPQPFSTFVQTFVADEFQNLLAISAGTWA